MSRTVGPAVMQAMIRIAPPQRGHSSSDIIRRMRDMAPNTHSFILDLHEAIGISGSAARLLKITVLENLAGDMANRLRGANQWIAALARSMPPERKAAGAAAAKSARRPLAPCAEDLWS